MKRGSGAKPPSEPTCAIEELSPNLLPSVARSAVSRAHSPSPKQRLRCLIGPPKRRSRQLRFAFEAQLLLADLEHALNGFGERAFAFHAVLETRVVEHAAAHFADAAQHFVF